MWCVQLVDTDGTTVLEKIASYQKANKEVSEIGAPGSCINQRKQGLRLHAILAVDCALPIL